MSVNGGSAEISLGRPGLGARVLHRFIFGSLFVIGACLAASGAAVVGASTGMGAVLLVIGCAVMVGSDLTRRAHLRELDPGTMTITGNELRIDHPYVFKTPLRVPLENIRVAATEETEHAEDLRGGDAIDERRGFAVFGEQGGPLASRVRGYLWAEDAVFPVGRLGREAQRPNVLLLFASPVVVLDLKHETPVGPKGLESLGGLAVRVPDPEVARSVFLDHRLRAQIREDDLDRLREINTGKVPADRDDAITYERMNTRSLIKFGWLVAASGLLLPFVEIWALPLAVLGWRANERRHAIGISALAIAVLAFHVALLASFPIERPAQWALGGAVSALIGTWVGVELRRRTFSSRRRR